MNKLKLECHEANHICDKNQYNEASIWEKVVLTFHLTYCRACRQYTARNTKLTKLIKKPEVEILDLSAKEQINAAFQRELSNHQH